MNQLPQKLYGLAVLSSFLLPTLALVLGDSASAEPLTVHVGYIIPSNRTAQPGAVDNLSALMVDIQGWYAEQLDRNGFGPKTFQLQTKLNGIAPTIHIESTPLSDADIRSNIWSQTISAAQGAGLTPWTTGEQWFLVSEAHTQASDGSISGGTALGASFGSGRDPGVAMVGGDFIFRANRAMLSDTTAYTGQTVPAIGPFPLAQGKSFPSFVQTTFSSIASSAQGAAAHELGHAFGLPHDFRNDSNFRGVLMGNGLRGWRGSLLPDRFPQDDVQLGYAAALSLSVNRYFNADQTFTENTKPALSIATSGTLAPVDGKLKIDFSASDTSGLAVAILHQNGDVVDEMKLDGSSSISASFLTPYYTPGQNDEFKVSVFDSQGNKASVSSNIIVNSGSNRAPRPSIKLFGSLHTTGDLITLDATASADPDGSSSQLMVEWDLNGDGIFDTAPSINKTLTTSFKTVGTGLIYARVTDTLGASSISTPLAYRTVAKSGDRNVDLRVDLTDLALAQAQLGKTSGRTDLVEILRNFGSQGADEKLVARGAHWRFLDNGSNQNVVWREPTFNDDSWKEGPAQLGYGDDDEATEIQCGPSEDCSSNNHTTSYFRHTFELDVELLTGDVRVWLLRDDAAAVYLNGTEVFRDKNLLPGATFDTLANPGGKENGQTTFSVDDDLLVDGVNVVAVEVHQTSRTSSDVSFDFELIATLRAPNTSPSAASLVVPEPTTCTFATLALICCAFFRRQHSAATRYQVKRRS